MSDDSSIKKSISGHWVGQQGVLPSPSQSTQENNFITSTRFNMQHGQKSTFQKRAQAFSKYQPIEELMIDEVNAGMSNPRQPSPEVMQSGWMLHAQRGMFGKSDDLRSATIGKATPPAQDLIGMMQRNEQGPLTFEQSQLGAEVAVTSYFMQPKEVQNQLKKRHIKADRDLDETGQVSHQTKSAFGMGLSNDPGTKVRDQLGLPVMSGTSGTSSSMALSHEYAAHSSGMGSPFDSTQSPSQGVESMSKLSMQYMRQGALPQIVRSKTESNLEKQHSGADLVSQPSHSSRVQTHTFPEIYSAVDMTMYHESPKNMRAHVGSNIRAKTIMDNTPNRVIGRAKL